MALDDDVALLAKVPMLEPVGAEALRILAFGSETRTLGDGDILFREGEDADGGYLVTGGVLALKSMLDPDRGEYLAKSGTLIGETALITDVRRPATAIAREPTTVLRIPRHVFRRMLEGYPEAARALRRLMAERLAETGRDLARIRHRLETLDRVPQKPDWV